MKRWTWSQAWSRTKASRYAWLAWLKWPRWLGWSAARVPYRIGVSVLAFVTPLRKWLVDILVVAVGLVFVVSAALELRNTAPVMDPISIPKSLVERGYSGDIIAARLIDAARAIERETNARSDSRSAAATTRFTPALDVTVPGSGVSLAVVVETVRRLFGRQVQRIGGEIVTDESGPRPGYRMTVRISKPPWAFTSKDHTSLDVVIRSSAEQLTGVMRPCAFAALLLDTGGARDDIDRLINACERSGDDLEWVYNLRGLRLAEQGKFDEAIEQYRRALELFPTYFNAQRNLAAARNREPPKHPPAAGSPPPR